MCPAILLGRDAHLDELDRALDEVCKGHGQTVLIAGEAGIGKSRLVREIWERATRKGFINLKGHCFELDRILPYAAVLDLLRTRLADQSPDRITQELGATAPELVKLLPELATVLPGLTPTPSLEPEQERRRLFHTLVQFLAGLAARQRLLVVFEDLHWSDDTSLDFVLFLAYRVATRSILLLGTYRNDETHPGLAHFLAQVDRARLATELTLPRLDQAEVGEMVRAICEPRRPVAPQFVNAVFTLTDGNPFFIEEVLRSLIAPKAQWDGKRVDELPIPRSVQDAVQRRVAQLHPGALETLRLAAIAGRRFDFVLLQALTRQDERKLLGTLKQLIAAHLVVEDSDEHFAFRHALTREAICSQLLTRERKALHRRIAETMKRVYMHAIDRHRADLANHFFEAEDWSQALEYAQRAGEQAQAFYAPRAAIDHFTHALDAASHLPTGVPLQLHRARGQAYKTLGAFDPARADYETALSLAQSAGDRYVEWQVLLELGLLWASRDYVRTGEYYRRALALAHLLDNSVALGRSLNRLGNWYVNVEQPLVGRRHHEDALAIFEALADRRGIVETLDLLAMARRCSGDLLGSTAMYERALVLLRELDDRHGLVMCLALLAGRTGDGHFDPLGLEHAEFARAMDAGQEARAIAHEIEWRAGEAFAAAQVGQCLGAWGEYGRALEAAQEAHRIAGAIEHRQWLAFANEVLGRLYLDLLALPAARQHLEHALLLARDLGSRIWLHATSGALIATCVQQGDLERAEAVLAAVPDFAGPPQSAWQRLLACARVELALAQHDPQRALALADQVCAALALEASDGSRRVGPPRLGRLRAQALAALGRVAEAESSLQADLAAARARNCLPPLWRLHATLTCLYRADGRRAAAERQHRAARTIIEELAAKVPETPVAALTGGSLRDHFRQSAAALVTDSGPLRAVQGATRVPDDLTSREVDVLRLLALGRSNREIAGDLVISVRTVEHHITSIYDKTGARRRAAASAYAVRHGLLPDGPDR